MDNPNLYRGAKIVINKWVNLMPWERLLIVTGSEHVQEANVLKKIAMKRAATVDIMLVEKSGKQVGIFFDENETIFDDYQAIIGATNYSLVTTLAAKRAIKRKSKFLSLPLHTNNGISMLEYDFLTMDTKKSKMMARLIIKHVIDSQVLHVTTALGTDIYFYKKERPPGFFNGVVKDGKGYSSASIELYVPIEEDKTHGTFYLDGSFGYIGKVTQPVKLVLEKGRIVDIEQNESGKKLIDYFESFKDNKMYHASEFAIGLNTLAHCDGNCYIEDESAYGTFHIGFGRNLALGGIHEATGHFDLVSYEPDIYADNQKIMDKGKIIIPENQFYQ